MKKKAIKARASAKPKRNPRITKPRTTKPKTTTRPVAVVKGTVEMTKPTTALELLQVREKPVRLSSLDIPAFNDAKSGYNIAAQKLKKDIVYLLRAVTYGPDNVQLVYWHEGEQYEMVATVRNTFPIEVLEADQAKDLLRAFGVWQLRNLPSQLNYGYSSGADPEFFVEDEKGEIIPSFKFLGPKPEKPFVGGKTNDIYWDGFQAEFTVTAGTCVGHLMDRMYLGLRGLLQAARKYNPKARLSAKTVFDIPVQLIRESAPEHVAFGCMPSLNVYGLKGLEAPGTEVFYRSTGGHLHFGFSGITEDQIKDMVRALDAIVGVAGVSLFAKFDTARRRTMYGLAGEYRMPKHGLEYRVLSNAWLFHPLIANIIYDLARPAATLGMRGLLKHWDATESETIAAINNHDVELARTILKRNRELLNKILMTKMGTPERADFVIDIILGGIENALVNPTDIEGNWLLSSNNWKNHCSNFGKNIANAHAMYLDGVKKV